MDKFDVVAVSNGTNVVRIMATGKSLDNAEAIAEMAVIRRGVDEFFSPCVAGKYHQGDKWNGTGF